MRSIPLILVMAFLAGCIANPHMTLRSPEVRGRVFDANTHAAIEGAKIFLTDHPQVSCQTDSTGSFWLKETHNFHMGGVPPEGDWPQRKYWEDHVTISQTNYIPLRISHWPVEKGSDKGDIFLRPK